MWQFLTWSFLASGIMAIVMGGLVGAVSHSPKLRPFIAMRRNITDVALVFVAYGLALILIAQAFMRIGGIQ